MSDTDQSMATSSDSEQEVQASEQIAKPKQPKKKNQTKWVRALKGWNAQNENWVIPKKGTKQYKSLMKYMNKMQ